MKKEEKIIEAKIEDNNKKISFASSFGLTEIEEGKKEEYKEAISLLKKGYSIRNVAKLTGRAVSTLQTIKKEFIND